MGFKTTEETLKQDVINWFVEHRHWHQSPAEAQQEAEKFLRAIRPEVT